MRVIHPHRRIDVAHEGRDTRARLRDALNLELVAGFLDLRQIDALRHRLHQFIEQVHDFGPLALQFLDDFHARDQALLAILEILDVGDLRIELDDLLLQKIVLLVLRIGPAGVQQLAAARRITTAANTAPPRATMNSRRRTLRSCSRQGSRLIRGMAAL